VIQKEAFSECLTVL